jgi:hypothetical protein
MKKWIVCLVLGVLPLIGSTGWLREDDKPGEITCGSDVMRPGDVCQETRRGVVVDTETYEEKVKAAKEGGANFASTGRWVLLGIGLALECLGIVGMVVTRRRRARRAPTTADLALSQHPAYAPGYVVQQPVWPQGTTPRPQHPQAPQHPPAPQHPQAPQHHPQQPFGPGR